MFKPRRIETSSDWLDSDGIKLYTISATGKAVVKSDYLSQLQVVKSQKRVDWKCVPSFVIFHEGSNAKYLVLAWWENENEMFVSVSVREQSGWLVDSGKYSFCLWDLEILWAEKNIYIATMYSGKADLDTYRHQRLYPA
ncbi:MAG: hypothetical protein F6K00_03730 [Leptolyngbya sp. SIOISBB]|nr:hypothetical protein [Leptolyngbya sp. SIOISBB]